MSKLVEVMLPDDEYRAAEDQARRQGIPVAELVRESLRRMVAESEEPDPEARIEAVLRFAQYAVPTGDIEQILDEIERGRTAP